MTHTLRKYLSSRGSALFMVLSTMTALMIAAMAMYFSVISSRQVQYAVFNEEQSYQSAVSITDAIIAGLNDGKLNGLQSDILALTTGGAATSTLSTNGNGFKTFSETGTKDDEDQIGAYDVNITRLNDSNGYQVYDFCVAASVDGVQETTHTMVMMKQSKRKYKAPTNLFTATGYTPNTNFISTGKYLADLDIDSQTVIFGRINSSGNGDDVGPTIPRNLTCAGTAEFFALNTVTTYGSDPRVWTFGGDLILHSSNVKDPKTNVGHSMLKMFGTAEKPGMILVGGDVRVEDGGALSVQEHDIMYVLGDLYTSDLVVNGELYVNGNIYVADKSDSLTSASRHGKIHVSVDGGETPESHIMVTHGEKQATWSTSDITVDAWGSAGSDPEVNMDLEGAKQALNDNIGSIVYPIWTVDWSEIGGYTESETIMYNGAGWGNISYKGNHIDQCVTYESEALKYREGNHGCIINDIIEVADDWDNITADGYEVKEQRAFFGTNRRHTIIVDTGNDEKNVFYLGLNANHKLEIDGETINIFSWRPNPGSGFTDNTLGTNVLVRGKGSLVMVLPKGVVYQSNTNDFIGHENWFFLLGGKANNADGLLGLTYGGVSVDNGTYNTAKQYLHNKCTGDNKCDIDQNLKKYQDPYGGEIEGYWCNTHNCAVTMKEPTEDGKCGCISRVGRKEIDKVLASGAFDNLLYPPEGQKYKFNVDGGNFIYPTVNIWLISEDANADMRFVTPVDDQDNKVSGNLFMGYVYAPYMSFTADVGPAGSTGGLRFVGGLIVSDVKLNDWNDYLFCIPEKSYVEIGDLKDINDNDIGKPTAVWRVYGY